MDLEVIEIGITKKAIKIIRRPKGKKDAFCNGVSEIYSLSENVRINNGLDDKESKLNRIWKAVNNAHYLGDMKKRNFYNLIHEIAEIINPNYEEIGTEYIE